MTWAVPPSPATSTSGAPLNSVPFIYLEDALTADAHVRLRGLSHFPGHGGTTKVSFKLAALAEDAAEGISVSAVTRGAFESAAGLALGVAKERTQDSGYQMYISLRANLGQAAKPLNPPSVLRTGSQWQMEAELAFSKYVQPEEPTFRWESSNAEVLNVEDAATGLVSAVSEGEATLTVYFVPPAGWNYPESSRLGAVQIRVLDNPATLDSVAILPQNPTLRAGTELELTLQPTPDNALVPNVVTWSSSNETIATVTKNGLVTGISQGNATITATLEWGENTGMTGEPVTAERTVAVTEPHILQQKILEGTPGIIDTENPDVPEPLVVNISAADAESEPMVDTPLLVGNPMLSDNEEGKTRHVHLKGPAGAPVRFTRDAAMAPGYMLTVTEGSVLVLENIILDGNSDDNPGARLAFTSSELACFKGRAGRYDFVLSSSGAGNPPLANDVIELQDNSPIKLINEWFPDPGMAYLVAQILELEVTDAASQNLLGAIVDLSYAEDVDESEEERGPRLQSWEGIENLTGLRSLYIWDAPVLTGELADLASLSSLRWLDLGYSPGITGNFEDMPFLKNLGAARMFEVGVTGDLSSFSDFNGSILDLDLEGLTGELSDIAGLDQLIALSLGKGSYTGTLADISGLTNLTNLGLVQTAGSLASLSGMTEMSVLNLSDPGVTGNLADMKDPRVIELDGTAVYGDFSALAGFEGLELVSLKDLELELPTLYFGEGETTRAAEIPLFADATGARIQPVPKDDKGDWSAATPGKITWNRPESENETYSFTFSAEIPFSQSYEGSFTYSGTVTQPVSTAIPIDLNETEHHFTNSAQLAALRNLVNGGQDMDGHTVILDENITLPAGNWAPIGTKANPFRGVFDGDGHSISGLSITGTGSNAGLFGYVEPGSKKGGIIRNVGVKEAAVKGGANVAAIVGYLGEGGLLERSFATGRVEGASSVGGLVGTTEGGTIRNAYYNGLVKGDLHVASIAGQVAPGTVQYCYAAGQVDSPYSVETDNSDGSHTIKYSESSGLVANLYGGTVQNTVALHSDLGELTRVIGRMAYPENGKVMLEESYAWWQLAGPDTGSHTTSIDGEDISGRRLAMAATWEDLFEKKADWAWTAANGKLPVLSGFKAGVQDSALPAYLKTDEPAPLQRDASWYDSAKTSHTITSFAQLADFADKVRAGDPFEGHTISLGADITAEGDVDDLPRNGNWLPIGSQNIYPQMPYFGGTFDGRGHTITGIIVNHDGNAGLFDYTRGAIIKNLGLVDADIRGTYMVGGIAGSGNATIQNCFVTGTVGRFGTRSGNDFVGGIAGTGSFTVRHCYTDVLLDNPGISGGIVGQLGGGRVENCYALGWVSGTGSKYMYYEESCVGGIVGAAGNGPIKNNVALNAALNSSAHAGSDVVLRRIAGGYTSSNGSADPRVLSGNYGLANMQTLRLGQPVSYTFAPNAIGPDGADVDLRQAGDAAFWQKLGFTTANGWSFDKNSLPILTVFGPGKQAQNPPAHLVPAQPVWNFTIDGATLTGSVYQFDYSTTARKLTLRLEDTSGSGWLPGDVEWNVAGLPANKLAAGSYDNGIETRVLTLDAKFGGQVVVTVKNPRYDITKTVTLFVDKGEATGVSLDATRLRLAPGGTGELTLVPTPAGSHFADGDKFTWATAGSGVVSLVPVGPKYHSARLTGLSPGTQEVLMTAIVGGKPVTLTCAVTVGPDFASIAVTPGELVLRQGKWTMLSAEARPVGAVLPGDLVWSIASESESGVVALDAATGRVDALKTGTATVRVASAASPALYGECSVVVSVAPTKVELKRTDSGEAALPTPLKLETGATAKLAAKALPEAAAQDFTWRSDNPQAATVSENGLVTAQAAGTAIIYATAVDGGLSATCTVVVEEAVQGALAMETGSVLLPSPESGVASPTDIPLVLGGLSTGVPASGLKAQVYLPATSQWADSCPEFDMDIYTNPLGRSAAVALRITPAADVSRTITRTVRVRCLANPTIYTECRVTVTPTVTGNPDEYAPVQLAAATATAYARRTSSVGEVPLLRDLASDKAQPLLMDGFTVEADGGLAGKFTFTVKDEETLAIGMENRSLTGKHSGTLTLKKGAAEIPLGALTLSVDGKLPKVAAAAVAANTFYDEDLTRPLVITGAAVEGITMVSQLDILEKVDVTDPANPIVTFKPGGNKGGTLTLAVKLKDWGKDEKDTATVKVKVNRTSAAPGVKLSTTKPKLFADMNRGGEVAMTLLPKSGKDTLARLGITNVVVASKDDPAVAKYKTNIQDLYDIADPGLNPETGAFTLVPKTGELAGGKLLLQATVAGSSGTVSLPVTVGLVKADTTIKLTANKSTVTLNQNLEGGEWFDFVIGTNVAGYAPTAGLEASILDKSGKYAPDPATNPPEVLWVNENVVRVAVGEKAPANATYKLELRLPYANTGKNPHALLRLTVKTAKAGAAGTAKVSLAVKGKPNLTTGVGATVTVKLTGYGGSFGQEPAFMVTEPGAATARPAREVFAVTQLSTTSWRFAPRQDVNTTTGTYQLAMADTQLAGANTVATTKTVKLAMVATRPKVTQSAKTVSLNRGDASASAALALSVPAGTVPLTTVKIKGAAANPDFPFDIKPLGDGRWAVTFNDYTGKTAAEADTLRRATATTTLTLEVWTQGNVSDKPPATIKVQVVVK